MTHQIPDQFFNEHPRVDLTHQELYFVSKELPVKPEPPEGYRLCTALWRGYLGAWRLNEDGALDLLRLAYPNFEEKGKGYTQMFEPAQMAGDFTLTFRPFFTGPNAVVPFQDGVIVEDRSKWEIEDQTFEVGVVRPLKQAGLVVQVPGEINAFLPKSLLLEPDTELKAMVGRTLYCDIFDRGDFGDLVLREVEKS